MNATLLDLFDDVLGDDGDADAFVQPLTDATTRRITFAEWAAAGDAVAQVLIANGAAPVPMSMFR